MKVEESRSPGPVLSSVPSVEQRDMVQVLHPPDAKWTTQDAVCAKLFGPWDNLPCYDHINEVFLLQDLDNSIVVFENRIHHSDVGFRAWRDRHKRAMEAGLTDIPGFPSLQVIRGEKCIWQDQVWEQRYHYLVHQRHHIVLQRLSRLLGLSRTAGEDFFGERPAPPRATIKKRTRGPFSRSLGLRCNWWRSLDYLLEKSAEKWGVDKTEIKARFWMDERRESVKVQQPCVETKAADERPIEFHEAAAEKENIEPVEKTVVVPEKLIPEVSFCLVDV